MWDGPTIQGYYADIERMTWAILSLQEAAYLRTFDYEEYLDYLVSKLERSPLEWDESSWSIEPVTVKVRHRNEFNNREYLADEDRFRLRVPLSPHLDRSEYLRYGPSTTRGSEPNWVFEEDILVHEVDATEDAVERGKENVRFWLGNRNNDIKRGNANLRERVKGAWESKRVQVEQQFNKTQAVLKKVSIPLHRDPNASPQLVKMKPRQLRNILKPKAKAAPAEPTLDREEVVALVSFIEEYARTFEVTPKPYLKFSEEELRDLLLGMIKKHYPGQATGETFRKLGKTDISFQVDNANVLVCECKMWSGPSGYGKALEQLFGYLTWRDNHGVLISFCTLKDMTRAVSGATHVMEDHDSFVPGTLAKVSETRFVSRHKHPQDNDKSLEVHHLFFDLSV